MCLLCCFSSNSPPEASATVGRTSWTFICTRCRLTRPLVKNTQPWWSVSSFRESQNAGNFVFLCVFTLSPQHRSQNQVWARRCTFTRVYFDDLRLNSVTLVSTRKKESWVDIGRGRVWRVSAYNPSNWSNKAVRRIATSLEATSTVRCEGPDVGAGNRT